MTRWGAGGGGGRPPFRPETNKTSVEAQTVLDYETFSFRGPPFHSEPPPYAKLWIRRFGSGGGGGHTRSPSEDILNNKK